MANRREVLTGVAAASALPLVGLPAPARASPRPYKLLIDRRFPEARAAAARTLLPVEAMEDGDVSGFWVRELEPLWREGPVALSGVTTRETLHCLELLAAGRRAKVTALQPRGELAAWTIAPVGRT